MKHAISGFVATPASRVFVCASMVADQAEIEDQRCIIMAFTWLKLMLRALELKKRRVNFASLGHWLPMVKQRGKDAVKDL